MRLQYFHKLLVHIVRSGVRTTVGTFLFFFLEYFSTHTHTLPPHSTFIFFACSEIGLILSTETEKFGLGEDAKLKRAHTATRQNLFSAPGHHLNVFFISCAPASFVDSSIGIDVESSSFHSNRINRLANPFWTVRHVTFFCSCFVLSPHRISFGHKPSTAIDLSQTHILKIAFQIVDDADKGVQPHQTFLRFYDKKSGEEGIQPIRVTPGGKAKFELVCHRIAIIPV